MLFFRATQARRGVPPSGRGPVFGARAGMNDDEPGPALDDEALRARLSTLKVEHEDLSAAVEALEAVPRTDQIRIARLKKKKLALRDEIVRLEDRLTPDIIA